MNEAQAHADPLSTTRRPRLSVLLPLGDARIGAVENVACWTQGQTCDGRDFEVVAVADGSEPAMERAVTQILRAHDKIVTCPRTEHVEARLARAAGYADGDVLLFAEHHCRCEASCVEATLRFFEEREEAAAGILAMKQRRGARHGDLDERWFAEMEGRAARRQSWRKLQTGAFAMRRGRYFDLGGHDGRFGLFADQILSAKAHQAGYLIDAIPGPAVTHITALTMQDHQHHVEDYTRGECAFRATHDPKFCDGYFGHAHTWSNRVALDPAVARAALAALLRVLVRDLRSALGGAGFRRCAGLIAEIARRAPLAVLGPSAVIGFAKLRMHWSELRAIHLSRASSSRWRHFERAWAQMIELTRMRCAIEQPASAAAVPVAPDIWPVTEILESQRAGFHGLENFEGAAFRWSEPVMMLRLARPPGQTQVTIDMAPVRGHDPDFIRGVFWEGGRVAGVDVGQRHIRFPLEITSASPQWLTIVATPLAAPGDSRRLGVPVRGLSFATPR